MQKIIFPGTSNPKLSRQIAKQINAKIGKLEIKQFSDNEIYVRIKEDVKNQEVFVVQTCAHHPHHFFFESLIIIDALKRLKPKKINLILTFYPYRRQDRLNTAGESLSAELVAQVLSQQKLSKIYLTELHTDKIIKFLNGSVKHIRTLPLFINYYKNKFKIINNLAVASPDLGASDEAARLASALKVPHVKILKFRPEHEKVTIKKLSGKVQDKKIILLDDEINTGSTILKASQTLIKHGAQAVYVAATHGLFTKNCLSKIEKSKIKEVVITDSIRQDKKINKLKVISLADIIAKNI